MISNCWLYCKEEEKSVIAGSTPGPVHSRLDEILLEHMWIMLGIYVNIELANPLTKCILLVIG